MASLYKRTHRRPLPKNATVTKTIKPLPAGASIIDGIATWTDRTGCLRSAAVSGNQVEMQFATWTNQRNHVNTLPVDHTGTFILVADVCYMASITNARGKRIRKSTKTSDKAVAIRIASKWESDARLREEGVVDDLVESLARHAAKPIAEHVDAFIAFLATKGGTEEHRTRTRRQIEEFVNASKWKWITDLDADGISAHVATMMSSDAAARTIQQKLTSIKSFSKWLADHHRLMVNPLSMVKKPDPNANRRHERRMLLPDEWRWLESVTLATHKDRNSMTAYERTLLYRLTIQTGLRASEVFEVPRSKLILARGTPHVLCKAAGTKNRKPAKQYIDQALADDLRNHVASKHPTAPVFGIGSKEELSRVLELDLADARRSWLSTLDDDARVEAESSDFLMRTNHDGEHLVFHSLRHSCGAWLAMAGVHVKTVQSVMRHGSIGLTMDRYRHLFPGQAEDAASQIAAMMNGSTDKGLRVTAG